MINVKAENINLRQTSAAVVVTAAITASALTLPHTLYAEAGVAPCHQVGSATVLSVPFVSVEAEYVEGFNLGEYLKVDKDVVWVTPDVWEQLLIMSNVDWTIE